MSNDTILENRILDILLSFGIKDDCFFQVPQLFKDKLLEIVMSRKLKNNELDAECILNIIIELYKAKAIDDYFVFDIIPCLENCKFPNRTICKFFDVIRQSFKPSTIKSNQNDQSYLDQSLISSLLNILKACVKGDDPSYLFFPGDKDSFLQVSSIPWCLKNGFTLTIWMKIRSRSPNNQFELFRCRSPILNFDCYLYEQNEEGAYGIKVIVASDKKNSDEVNGKIYLPFNNWHLIAIQFDPNVESENQLVISIDGQQQISAGISFPFVDPSLESHWTFGLGYRGMIASIALYEKYLPLPMVDSIYSIGPFSTELKHSISTPQSSYDSGYSPLGCNFSKEKLFNLQSVFSINPIIASTNYNVSLTKIGKFSNDHILMIPPTEKDSPLIASLTGKCYSVIGKSWVENLIEAGGCTLLLYLIWSFSNIKFTPDNEIMGIKYLREGIKSCIEILSIVISKTVEIKEQFLQVHGFHIISSCLSSLPLETKKTILDSNFMDTCFELIKSLGPDSLRGDGIASAFQGLVFDFRIWGVCNLTLLKYYLSKVCEIASKAPEQLYFCIGVQKLLDIFRVHLTKIISSGNDKSLTDEQFKQLAISCSDEMHHLLILTIEAAQVHSSKFNTTFQQEIDKLLFCLEETNNNYLAERLMRIISNIRVSNPISLRKSFIANRFHDTILVTLWLKKGFSLEVRSGGLFNLLWLMSNELKHIPDQTLAIRKSLRSFYSSLGISNSKNKLYANEVNKINVLLAQLKEDSKGLCNAWKSLKMVSEIMSKSLNDNVWGNFQMFWPDNLGNKKDQVLFDSIIPLDLSPSISLAHNSLEELQNTLISIINVNKNEMYLTIPFLPSLMSRVTYEVGEKILMLMNVQFKANENLCEALSCFDDRSWLDVFLLISINGFLIKGNFQDHLTVEEKMNLVKSKAFNAYSELALDITTIVLDFRTKYFINESHLPWKIFCDSLHKTSLSVAGDPTLANIIETRILKRSIIFFLQRLIKENEEFWGSQTLRTVDHILDNVQTICICNNEMELNSVIDILNNSTNSNDETYSIAYENNQLIGFSIDILYVIRRLSKKRVFNGNEWNTLKKGLHVIINNLSFVDDSNIERACQFILLQIRKMCEPSAPFSDIEFSKVIYSILFTLRENLDSKTKPSTKNAIKDLIFSIISFFTELRCRVDLLIPDHIQPLMKQLLCVETFKDVNLIFEVLDNMLKGSSHEVIVFDEIEDLPKAEDELEVVPSLSSTEDNLLDLDNNFAAIFSEPNQFEDLLTQPESKLPSEASSVQEETLVSNLETDILPLNSINTLVVSDSIVEMNPPIVVATNNSGFSKWLKVRTGISADRIDTERTRLNRLMNAQDFSFEATKRFWRKARKKLESECFFESHYCQWKLGIAHEGTFYGRKRLILRPIFDDLKFSRPSNQCDGEISPSRTFANVSEEFDISSDELNRALAKEISGYINDVTKSESDTNLALADVSEIENKDSIKKNSEKLKIPGSGWGLVDADGSEEGYGVVGLEKETNLNIPSAEVNYSAKDEKKITTDVIGDIYLNEESLSYSNVVDTGPTLSGMRKIERGSAKQETHVVMITASGNTWGYLSFSSEEIFFRSSIDVDEAQKNDSAAVNLIKEHKFRRRRWKLDNIVAIYLRRYRLRDSAIEIFFRKGKHRSVFFDFGHTKINARQRNDFSRALMSEAPASAFKQFPSMSPFRLVYEHGIQEKWLNGKMSNFDYLMALNTLAGRSFNDLCQYPVMPWILKDYKSKTIDLSNENIYRDLSKPMGALNESRLKEFLDRFNSFEENVSSGIPAFMYGSHYSTMVGVVLHFLVRLQPFASLHKEMQNGHFDVSDRLFSSIPRSFDHNTTQLSEVKEITPEWFTTPEMFKNINNFYFGESQDGELVGDVELPPWAKTAEDFVRIHREALESNYVTEHLHEWIDLIFGYKQRGPDSIEAHNVFYYLTYYGAVDHYMIQDETLRRATELQIAHFGQIPMQLFNTPHPARKVTGLNSTLPLTRPLKQNFSTRDLTKFVDPLTDEESVACDALSTLIWRKSQTVVLSMSILNDRIICILDNGVIEILKYSTSEEAKNAIIIAQATKNPKGRPLKDGPSWKTEDLLFGDDPDFLNLSYRVGSPSDSTPNSISSSAKEDINQKILKDNESLFLIEKEYSHFDSIPRVPIVKANKLMSNQNKDVDSLDKFFKIRDNIESCESINELLASQVIFNRNTKLCCTIGSPDGTISVRELDTRKGTILSAGDFNCHRKRVVSLAMDSSQSDYNIVASCDESGKILVWTILAKTMANSGRTFYPISRRPQRLFRCDPRPDMHVEISWQMGIVVSVSGEMIYIYSIERNELLRSFQIQYQNDEPLKLPKEMADVEVSCNGPIENLYGKKYSQTKSSVDEFFSSKYLTRRIVISDFGMIILHVEAFVFVESLLEFEEQLQNQHYLIAHTISGVKTASVATLSPVTCLVCPDHSDTVISGHKDGSILFYRCQDLSLLHRIQPCNSFNTIPLGLPSSTKLKQNGKEASSERIQKLQASMYYDRVVDNSAIISISLGPNHTAPSVICVGTEAGNLYIKAFPDFIKWEKNRSPSALSQLASVPIQAVKGTILQAQNWTAETAGVLAQNARSLADDALSEIKKLKRSSIVKGVAGFFGMGKNSDSSK